MRNRRRGLPAGLLAALVLGASLATLSACGAPEQVSEESGLALEPCQLSMPGRPWRFAAECGILTVPLDHDRPDGESLDLRLAVARAVSRDPEPDPLFLLAGGPGQAATEAFLPMLSELRPIRESRDLVMLDQRGTGRLSTLVCPDEDFNPAVDVDDEMIRRWVVDCREDLETDPALFTTEMAMRDLDAAREALGYETINLYGGSYGTRAGLTYMRMFPDRVRAVILDGVAPHSMAVGNEMGRDAQRAMDLLFERCAADEACRERFPMLAGTFRDLLERLDAEPILVELPDPTTGEPSEILLTREVAAGTLRSLSYSPEASTLIPILIESAHVLGDFVPLAAQSALSGQEASDTINAAMMMSVLCAEDAPFFAAPSDPEEDGFIGPAMRQRFAQACEEWPVATISESFKQPTPSDIPVLLMSGEADPVTPPVWADEAARSLENSYHLVAPGMAHIVLDRGCIPKIATSFIEQGSVDDLDTECVADLEAPPFFLSFTGPEP